MKKISTSWITQWGKDYLYHLKEIFQGKINEDNAGNKIEIENGVISHEEQYVRQTGNASSETLNFGDEFNVVTKSYGYDSYGHITSQSTNTKTYKLPNSPIIPTNTSDLTNDSGFITNTVSNLANYYLKTETYTQNEVNNLISQAVSGAFVVVNTLPTASADTMNKIYLVPKSSGSGSNLKDEYITVNNNGTYSWELIGDTAVDLTGYVKSIVVNGGTYTVASGTTTITLPDYYTESEIDNLLDNKVDKVAGKGLSTNDFDNAYKTKLDGIASGAEVNVQADWDETDTTSDAYIQNKPSNVVSDASYVHTDNNYSTAEKNKLQGIESGAEVNVQSNWNESDNTSDAFIQNKPSIPTALSDLTDDSAHRLVTDTEKSTWNSKSDFSGNYNDLTNKPTIPDELADLTDDSTHRLVTDTQISTWNNKSDFSGSYDDLTNLPTLFSGDYNDLSNKPTIPDELADLTDDTTHRLVTDTEKSTWNGKQNALTFDSTPTDGSTNPVTSDGIYDALSSKADTSDLSDYMTKVNPTGSGSLSINRKADTIVGNYSVAVGSRCEASGGNAFACGVDSVASGDNAHAEGVRVTASGGYSHAEGIETTASDYGAHAEGSGTTASNRYAHAEGNYSIASGYGSHAEGYYSSTNNKYYAHVEGYYTTAGRDRQSVCGQYNSLSTDAMFIVGNGTSNSAKSNALEVLSDGRVTVGADPVDDMDITTKQFVESYFEFLDDYSEEEF